MITSQVSRWGNSQGVRIPRKLLEVAGIEIDDNVSIIARNNTIMIKPTSKKTLEWYLEGYDSENERYDWGAFDKPKGRELF
jgi:antitoxin MazE